MYDQPINTPLTALTWPPPNGNAGAARYAVIIVDPDHTLPPTISITLTPTRGTLANLQMGPDGIPVTYTIPAALTDGTSNEVTSVSDGSPAGWCHRLRSVRILHHHGRHHGHGPAVGGDGDGTIGLQGIDHRDSSLWRKGTRQISADLPSQPLHAAVTQPLVMGVV